MQYDPYPDLPALPRAVQLACQTIEPEHLTMPTEDLHVVVEVSQSIHNFVSHCTPHFGDEAQSMVTYHALLAVQRVVEEALSNSGDVTLHD